MVEAGVVAKEQILAAARYQLATADKVAEQKREILTSLDQQRARLIDGSGDKAYAEALETMAEADAQDDLATLYREAHRTEPQQTMPSYGTSRRSTSNCRGLTASSRRSAKQRSRLLNEGSRWGKCSNVSEVPATVIRMQRSATTIRFPMS